MEQCADRFAEHADHVQEVSGCADDKVQLDFRCRAASETRAGVRDRLDPIHCNRVPFFLPLPTFPRRLLATGLSTAIPHSHDRTIASSSQTDGRLLAGGVPARLVGVPYTVRSPEQQYGARQRGRFHGYLEVSRRRPCLDEPRVFGSRHQVDCRQRTRKGAAGQQHPATTAARHVHGALAADKGEFGCPFRELIDEGGGIAV